MMIIIIYAYTYKYIAVMIICNMMIDDTQLYIAIEHSANLHSELLRMERCVADIRYIDVYA